MTMPSHRRRSLVTLFGTVTAVGAAAACTNSPQYVDCAPMGAAPTNTCHFEAGVDDGTGNTARTGSLHIPLKPEDQWRVADRERRIELQEQVDPSGTIEVPVYRLEHFDISVEWTVRNLEDSPGKFRVDLNGANEAMAYDPAMIMVADDEDPPAPPLAGNIPFDIGPMGTVTGVFREDQLREAAIDLDQITRGNVNPFAATLTISKSADSFQPVTPYDPATMTGGEPDGPAIPAAAFRQIVRVDITFRPSRRMEIEYAIRVREHVDVIHEMGLNAPADELQIIDPPYYSASLP